MLTSIGKLLYEASMIRDFSSNNNDLKNPESVQLFPSGQSKYLYSFYGTTPLPLTNLPRINTYTGSSTPGSGIYIGKGSGTPSANDYDLFDRINDNGLSSSTGTLGYEWVNDKYVYTLSWIITNSSQNSVTITEIGQVFQIETRTTPEATSHTSGYTLIEHDMLTDPLTLAAGEVGVIEWKREFDFTNFSPVS